MSSTRLIIDLRNEHAQMRDMLESVRRVGVSTAEGQRQLKAARQLIVDHLQHEDVHLYPALHGCPQTQPLANEYANEMQELSREILAFFDGMEREHDDLVFARGFGKLMGTLNKRWTREEVRLYPAYDAHCGDKLAAAG
ncbi:MAG TPA: hemerythrin domain-containing protein [Rhodanobacter sp.]|nr:hemerythrin domain-containing protein [Rhodanobacter sp.]